MLNNKWQVQHRKNLFSFFCYIYLFIYLFIYFNRCFFFFSFWLYGLGFVLFSYFILLLLLLYNLLIDSFFFSLLFVVFVLCYFIFLPQKWQNSFILISPNLFFSACFFRVYREYNILFHIPIRWTVYHHFYFVNKNQNKLF